ncbi:MAG: YihY/virulence factor BrkB family protein [Gammaproteobacteria bacterium]|nr:YihY/virulence factor BrkB family protein [Gammaproteobacteria bacterium]MDH5728307.1 YihY/virulence factor BrkB family protein [Gammaproteobacteria bacterium]
MKLRVWINNLSDYVWNSSVNTPSILRRSLQIISLLIYDIVESPLMLYAGSLVYTTLVAFVPTFALLFFLLQSLQLHVYFAPLILDFVEPLGEAATELVSNIIAHIGSVNLSVLSLLGLLMLVSTIVMLMIKLDVSVNMLCYGEQRRAWWRRLKTYLGALVLTPLVFSLLALLISFFNWQVIQSVVQHPFLYQALSFFRSYLSYGIFLAVMTLLYWFTIMYPIRFKNALLGAFLATSLWHVSGWAMASFLVSSTRLNILYSGFAISILLLFWLFFSWVVFLIGAKTVFYLQQGVLLKPSQFRQLQNKYQDDFRAIQLLLLLDKQGELSDQQIMLELQFPEMVMNRLVSKLKQNQLIQVKSNHGETIQLHKPLVDIQLRDISEDIWKQRRLSEQASNPQIQRIVELRNDLGDQTNLFDIKRALAKP